MCRSYLVVFNLLLKKFANDQAIAEMDSEMLHCIQPAHMTSLQNAYDLYAKCCKVADVYGESTLNEIFSEGTDPSICHSLRE